MCEAKVAMSDVVSARLAKLPIMLCFGPTRPFRKHECQAPDASHLPLDLVAFVNVGLTSRREEDRGVAKHKVFRVGEATKGPEVENS